MLELPMIEIHWTQDRLRAVSSVLSSYVTEKITTWWYSVSVGLSSKQVSFCYLSGAWWRLIWLLATTISHWCNINPEKLSSQSTYTLMVSVADPGFPRGGGANPKGGGANLLFGQFFQKTAWKWRYFGPGGCVPRAPLRSATGCGGFLICASYLNVVHHIPQNVPYPITVWSLLLFIPINCIANFSFSYFSWFFNCMFMWFTKLIDLMKG